MARKSTRMVATESTVDALVSDAFNEIETLQGEMQDWYDNMPENLQGGSKGDAVQEASDALQNISEADTPAILQGVKTSYLRDTKARSRPDRLADAVSMLQTALDTAQDMQDKENEKPEGEKCEEVIDELQSFIDDVQGMIDEAEGVQFPGMFG